MLINLLNFEKKKTILKGSKQDSQFPQPPMKLLRKRVLVCIDKRCNLGEF